MNITIKNLKHSEFASEETNCFEATLYVDGQPLCKVSNDGKGGADNYHPIKKGIKGSELWERIQQINNELGKETIKSGEFEIENSLEIVVGELVSKELIKRDLKKTFKKKVCFVDEDCKKRHFKSLPKNFKPNEQTFQKLKAAPWWKDENVILNEIPLDEAVQYI